MKQTAGMVTRLLTRMRKQPRTSEKCANANQDRRKENPRVSCLLLSFWILLLSLFYQLPQRASSNGAPFQQLLPHQICSAFPASPTTTPCSRPLFSFHPFALPNPSKSILRNSRFITDMLAGAMDPIDAAESGWWTKRRRSSARGGYSKLAASNGKKKSGTLRCWTLGIVALLALVILLFLLVMMVDLEQAIESGKKILKIPKGGCTSCEDLTIRGSDKFVTFDRSTDEKGCARLTIQCGLDTGTEAIIQWFQNDKDMGASFMNEEGQSNVRRTLECNPDGQYELDENGHKGIITAIDCIVAVPHEEL